MCHGDKGMDDNELAKIEGGKHTRCLFEQLQRDLSPTSSILAYY